MSTTIAHTASTAQRSGKLRRSPQCYSGSCSDAQLHVVDGGSCSASACPVDRSHDVDQSASSRAGPAPITGIGPARRVLSGTAADRRPAAAAGTSPARRLPVRFDAMSSIARSSAPCRASRSQGNALHRPARKPLSAPARGGTGRGRIHASCDQIQRPSPTFDQLALKTIAAARRQQRWLRHQAQAPAEGRGLHRPGAVEALGGRQQSPTVQWRCEHQPIRTRRTLQAELFATRTRTPAAFSRQPATRRPAAFSHLRSTGAGGSDRPYAQCPSCASPSSPDRIGGKLGAEACSPTPLPPVHIDWHHLPDHQRSFI